MPASEVDQITHVDETLWMEKILHHQKDGWIPINNGMFTINWCRISQPSTAWFNTRLRKPMSPRCIISLGSCRPRNRRRRFPCARQPWMPGWTQAPQSKEWWWERCGSSRKKKTIMLTMDKKSYPQMMPEGPMKCYVYYGLLSSLSHFDG